MLLEHPLPTATFPVTAQPTSHQTRLFHCTTARVNYSTVSDETMAEAAEYRVTLDPSKVQTLERLWRQDTPEKLLQSLFDLAYHYYVEEEDELIAGALLRKRVAELEFQIEDLRRRLASKDREDDKTLFCPSCGNKLVFLVLSGGYLCTTCGWEGPREKGVQHQNSP